MLPFEDPSSLPLLFHLNSEPWLNLEAYAEHTYRVEHKATAAPAERVSLPVGDGDSRLFELLAGRRSCRAYEPRSLELGVLATLLRCAYGATHLTTLPGGLQVGSRTVPSAGGLYPLEIYLFLQRIEGVEDGLYHYHHLDQALEPVPGGGRRSDLDDCLLAQPFLEHANIILLLSAVFSRTLSKYGPRGYRYILLEAGHMAQNFCLAAGEQGLASLCVGGFMDGQLNRVLGLDGVEEGVVYCLGAGHSAE